MSAITMVMKLFFMTRMFAQPLRFALSVHVRVTGIELTLGARCLNITFDDPVTKVKCLYSSYLCPYFWD